MSIKTSCLIILTTLLSTKALAEPFADINAQGKLPSLKNDKSIKAPSIEGFKACASVPTGEIGYTDDDRMIFRAKHNGKEGITIGQSFLPDSKVDELEAKFQKSCTFKTIANGKDLYFTIIGAGDDRKVSFSSIRPNSICSEMTITSIGNKQFQRQLVDLRASINKATKSIVEDFKSTDKERRENMVNKTVSGADREKYRKAWSGCLAALHDMSNENTEKLEKTIAEAENQYLFNNSSVIFGDTNLAIEGKEIKEVSLDWPYEKDLNACVDNMPLNRNVNTLNDGILFTGAVKGEQKFYYKAKDGKYYSLAKDALKRLKGCDGGPSARHTSCNYNYETSLPTGEKIGITLTLSQTKVAENTQKQNEQINFTSYLASNQSYTKIPPMEPVDEKEAVGTLVSGLQQALSNYTSDLTYHGANKISQETKDMFKHTFGVCRDFLNKVAPSEKRWNEFAYQYSLGGVVLERGVASEDEGQSSNTSK